MGAGTIPLPAAGCQDSLGSCARGFVEVANSGPFRRAIRDYSARRAISVLTFVVEHDSSNAASGMSSSTSSEATTIT